MSQKVHSEICRTQAADPRKLNAALGAPAKTNTLATRQQGILNESGNSQ